MKCSLEICDKASQTAGLCHGHYGQRRRGRPFTLLQSKFPRGDGICTFDGCDKKRNAYGLCVGHATQVRQNRPLVALRLPLPDQCLIDTCARAAVARGFCALHAGRIRRVGDPQADTPVRGYGEATAWRTNDKGYVTRRRIIDDRGGATEAQHRVVMEGVIGRKLVKGENVHHINGVKHDNRPENLELWNTSQPAGQRVEDKLAWAREIVALYSSLEEAA